MYARVIVDVPSKQTNRPFDYKIPPTLKDWVEVGSRVGVRFGPRMIQGFVVELLEQSEVDDRKLKSIESVLELQPSLTEELVELAKWMSRRYLCNEITALQVMLPGALKAKYEKYIALAEDSGSDSLTNDPLHAKGEMQNEIIHFIKKKQTVEMNELLTRFPNASMLIKKLIINEILIETQNIKNRVSTKKVLMVYPPDNITMLEGYKQELSKQAHKQLEVLQFFIDQPKPIQLSELTKRLNTSSSSIKSLASKQWLKLESTEIYRDPYQKHDFKQSYPLQLTEEQEKVFQTIRQTIHAKRQQLFLLHGVTGSGKTEIYLQTIQQCIHQNREAIVLVPEISLTPQMVERFKSRFGDLVAVLHSRLSAGERFDEWRKIQQKKVKVAIGARSAIFAPFTNIGLIIIDEEHETSYKQQDNPKYHAVEIAKMRSKAHQAAVILGSATPSLETYYESHQSTMQYLPMPSRVAGRAMPTVQVVDMREELKEGNRSMFSRPLHQAIEDRLNKKEQIVLLLNRRGYSTFVMCRSCGHVVSCPHCDISLTYHMNTRHLRCHYCGYAERESSSCPSCSSEHIRYFGTGTQKVEESLTSHFPGIRVIRMDVDTTSEKGSHEKWLNQFRDQKADVLLGTQMVAKGLDFPKVTLVGVIAADTVLNLPDFRAAEKTFQLLTQVSGRAGRHQLPGEVVIQTYNPDHYSVISASHHDYTSFMRTELQSRKQGIYPPYCKLILITFSHENMNLLVRTGESFSEYIKRQQLPSIIDVLGPVASPIPRKKDRYRFQCLIKYRGGWETIHLVHKAVSSLENTVKQTKLQVSVDVDPQMLM
ncbi:primosomal protein N' [Chengkuizengella axinellae]|uniref:Replication restart protein PriA n=1 Tax=Chengkuizengella axinellae TaxID=3064388 RepID=A0ABT9IVJ7_9BACL|nr:primosomal protein N' [Chengkuizengella sp. 2205SS18-9]MDP5273363.1 primosomal protein N' [Chengkuizengella sp. 2205SS18-9]